MVNGLSETAVVPDVARGRTLHHHIQSDRTALTQWKAIDHDFCGFLALFLHITLRNVEGCPQGWADVPDGTRMVSVKDVLKECLFQ